MLGANQRTDLHGGLVARSDDQLRSCISQGFEQNVGRLADRDRDGACQASFARVAER